MRLSTWLLTLPLLILGVAFTFANRAPVRLSFDPISPDSPLGITAPLFVWLLAALFAGFFLGAGAMWFTAGGVRRKARQRKREVKKLKKEAEAASTGETLPALR